MGRYAFFSTEFEYKFWFAIQPSEDILEFGGWDSRKGDMPMHKWTAAEDLEYIKEKLLESVSKEQIALPHFENYEYSIHGTYSLQQSVYDLQFSDPKIAAYFSLGCIIYHQLLWNPELTARYEL